MTGPENASERFTQIKTTAPIVFPGGFIPAGTSFPCFPKSQILILKGAEQAGFHALAGMWAYRLASGSEEFDRFLKIAGFPFPWMDDRAPVPLVFREIGTISLYLFEENIANACCEVVMNAANEGLWMGGGVAGALRSRGGLDIEKEARRHAPARLGDIVVTFPGNLKALQIYHAVVIDQHHMTRSELSMVESSFSKTLEMAIAEKVSGVTAPMLGCGVGGLETADVASSYLKICEQASASTKNPLMVVLVERDPDNIKNTVTALTETNVALNDDKEVLDFLKQYEESLKNK
ncbi:MAG TPA: macro domain-containing protein [Acidobacteriota bacterium]|nr:macro domain-containing protein [Acidobacteriota bacterium]HNT18319.1 macro domain-containing protein [Acidobacteriota bacterium]